MKFLHSIFFLTISFGAYAQKYELGVQAGASNYWGDLAPTVQLKESHPAAGVYGRVNFNHTWALRAEVNQMTLSASDANFDFNKVRNLSFQSAITEANLVLEFNYVKYGTHVLHDKFTSYVFAGVGGFVFNPQTYLHGTWYELRNYRTEGVGYSKYSFSVPFGIGVKYMLSNRLALESHVGFRKTFTDYIDDVSTVYQDVQGKFSDGGLIGATLMDRSIETYGKPMFSKGYKRGDPSYKDWYMTFMVGLSFRLNTRMKCARFF